MRRLIALFVFVFPQIASAQRPPSPLPSSMDVSGSAPVASAVPFGSLFHVNLGAGTDQGILPGDSVVSTALGAPIVIEILESTATTSKGFTYSARGGKLASPMRVSFRARRCTAVTATAPARVLSPNGTPPGWMELKVDSASGTNLTTADVDASIVAGVPAVAFGTGYRVTGTVSRIDNFAARITLASAAPAGMKWLKVFVLKSNCSFAGQTTSIALPLASSAITSTQPVNPVQTTVSFATTRARPGDVAQVRVSSGAVAFRIDSIDRSGATGVVSLPNALLTGLSIEIDPWQCGGPLPMTATTTQLPNGIVDLTAGAIAPTMNGTQATIDATGFIPQVVPGSTAIVVEKTPGRAPIYGVVDRVSGGSARILIANPTGTISRLTNNIANIRVPQSTPCQKP